MTLSEFFVFIRYIFAFIASSMQNVEFFINFVDISFSILGRFQPIEPKFKFNKTKHIILHN